MTDIRNPVIAAAALVLLIVLLAGGQVVDGMEARVIVNSCVMAGIVGLVMWGVGMAQGKER